MINSIAEQSKNYRYSTNHQVVIDADTRLIVMVGRPLPGNRNDCKAWEESGAKDAVGATMTIADGGYPGTGLVTPHRRRTGEALPDWKQAHNKSHKQVRAHVEHVPSSNTSIRLRNAFDNCRASPGATFVASSSARLRAWSAVTRGAVRSVRFNVVMCPALPGVLPHRRPSATPGRLPQADTQRRCRRGSGAGSMVARRPVAGSDREGDSGAFPGRSI